MVNSENRKQSSLSVQFSSVAQSGLTLCRSLQIFYRDITFIKQEQYAVKKRNIQQCNQQQNSKSK